MIYLYRCERGHEQERELQIKDLEKRVHCMCGRVMHRVPQTFAVNWGGLPPHKEIGRPPAIQNFINTAPERQAEYKDTKGK